MAIDEAFITAFRGVIFFTAGLAFLGALVGLVAIETRPRHGKQYE